MLFALLLRAAHTTREPCATRDCGENPPAEPLPSIREEALTTGESRKTCGVVFPVKAVSGFRANAQHGQHGGSRPLSQPELRH